MEDPQENTTPLPESPSKSLSMLQGSHHRFEGETSHVMLQGTNLGLILGCVAGVVFLVISLLAVFLYRRHTRSKRKHDFLFDGIFHSDQSCKSAPISRSSTPPLQKRGSCPDASIPLNNLLLRSMTAAKVPNFMLPPERVQPRSPIERNQSTSSLEYQQSFLGSFQPWMYNRSLSENEDTNKLCPSINGRLWSSMVYDAVVGELTVTLVKVKELPGRGKDNSPRDPFVKVFVLPDEKACHMSKVRKKTLTPVYNETFVYKVPQEEIPKRILRFSVYDIDKRKVRHSLGHVIIPLKDADLTKGETTWRDLDKHAPTCPLLGQLNINLVHLPNLEKVKVTVIETKQLRSIDYDRDNGVYLRVQMFHGHKMHKTKKTLIHQALEDLQFNESFAFVVPRKQLDTCSVVLTVLTTCKSPMTHDVEYGRIVLGSFMFARGEELLHWQETLVQPNVTVTRWHNIGPSLGAR